MAEKTLKNKVFINEYDLIEIVVAGDQTPESVNKMADQADQLIAEHRATGKPALVIDNLMLMGNSPKEVRKTFMERAKSMDYDRFALVSNDTIIRLAANLILQAVRKGDKIKYFDNYGEAVNWLAEKQ